MDIGTETRTLTVIVEPDGDRWHAYCPALESHGASTWANTREDGLQRIADVIQFVVDNMTEHGDQIHDDGTHGGQTRSEARVSIAV
jgi:predicted RNase H-like HicB family nuclease